VHLTYLQLIEKAARNGGVIITKDGQSLILMVPITKLRKERKFGTAKGLINMSDDFDQPLDDLKEYM
jgi:antitoxin (DNA-binding transcriptional repressor) of toxin-antitoxin stability system